MASNTDSREQINLLSDSVVSLGADEDMLFEAIYGGSKGSNTDSRAIIGLLELLATLIAGGGGGGGGGVRISRFAHNSLHMKPDGLYSEEFLISSRVNNILTKEPDGYFVGASSGGGGALLEDITSNVEVGAAPINSFFPKDLSFTDFAKKILIKEIAPSITFNATNAGTKEIGTVVNSTTLTLTITALNTGTPTDIEFYVGGNLVNTQPYVAGTNTYTYTYSAGISVSTTVKGVLKYDKSSGSQGTVEGSKSFTFVYASYYGVTSMDAGTITEAEVKLKTKNLSTAKGFTQSNIALNNERIVYAYPKSYGNLTLIKDGNNFDVTASFTRVDVAVNGIAYNVYVLNDPTTDSGIKMIYS